VANLDGTNPKRLTDHSALDIFPRFSPDGKWIAFNSNRMGNNDVWVVPITGGEAKQLTFHTTGDSIQYWTPDGKGIIISTSRAVSGWGSPLYIVPLDGRIPFPLDMDIGRAGMISQDGSKIAFNRNGIRYWRKQYKGNNQTDIWVQDLKTKKITQLTDIDTKEFRTHVQDAYPMWGADGMIYFLSERSGIFNIWKISPQGGDPIQVTSHQEDGVQYPSISQDGKTITYENEFDLWKLDIPGGTPERISISMDFDVKKNMVEYLKADNTADGFAPCPEGAYLAVDFHGEIFIVPTEEGIGEKTQVTSSPWRDRYQSWSPDGKHIGYVSDESLEEEIWLYEAATGKRKKVTTHESSKRPFVWSPDGKKIAYVAENTLFLYDLASNKNTDLAHNANSGYNVSEFSRDSNWLVINFRDSDENSDVHLVNINDKKEYNITDNPFRDHGGRLTPDGKRVIFRSNRDNGVYHLFVVELEKIKENPNDPLIKERSKNKSKEKKETAFEVKIDLNRIDKRAVQLTSGSNAVGSYFLSSDGKTVYFTSSDQKGSGLFQINIDGSGQKKVIDGNFSQLIPSADKKVLFYREQDKIFKMALSNKKKEQVKFNFTVKVDKRAEWEQIFEEAWRVMKYRFYDATMHGTDWAAHKKKYKPYLKYVGEDKDLIDLTNEMIGELNASHTGVSGPRGRAGITTYTTRYLGFEMEQDKGSYKVTHIYRDGPADKEWLDLKVGDYIHAIDGKPIKAGDNYWKILNEAINDFVSVKVSSSPDKNSNMHEIRIETVASLRNIKYEEFVANCREYVEKETDGKIAYVHIRSMNRSSLRRFENEVSQLWNKDGIIIDIRYNGGGNIDEPLLDIIERRPYAYVTDNRRGHKTWGRRHKQAIAGPKVMLINQRSFSDAEMTPAGFRVLGLGRIVGTPTGGGVIWTGGYGLINGGRIRTPSWLAITYDPAKPYNYGINLENFGVPPDVFVENTPEDNLNGYDRELKAAIDEVRRMIDEGQYKYKK
jgi:tricorn protease